MGKILVIDDEDNIRNIFKRALEKENHIVSVAENGKIGEDKYKQDKYDIVILDILMPDQEGIETILHLIAINSKAKIIAISGGGMGSANNYLDNALKLGASFAFEKPVIISDLLKKVALLINS